MRPSCITYLIWRRDPFAGLQTICSYSKNLKNRTSFCGEYRNVDLMCEVISKPDLIVVQLEQDVFLLLLKWVFLQNHPDYIYQPSSHLLEDAYAFFTSSESTYLETLEGSIYVPAFRSIRLEHIVNVYKTTERMLRDRIVPEAWLCNVFSRQWLRMLHAHDLQTRCARARLTSSTDELSISSHRPSTATYTNEPSEESGPIGLLTGEPGPRGDLAEEVFWTTSERCGRRMLTGDTTCSWRWTGYHFGIDIVIKYKRRAFSVIRFTESTSTEGAVTRAPRVHLLIAMRVKSVESDSYPGGNEFHGENVEADCPLDAVNDLSDAVESDEDESDCVSTNGMLSLKLEENSVHEILRVPDNFVFPAVVSANLLRYDPIGWSSPLLPASSKIL
ncbi:unnamed protein product [Calicophoron daubneyi]|uniref:Uncharacterized protein n=1 Tax=Calicophoron daubneyi TaxID=300641 RepID=A0AAV2TT63_CALDB